MHFFATNTWILHCTIQLMYKLKLPQIVTYGVFLYSCENWIYWKIKTMGFTVLAHRFDWYICGVLVCGIGDWVFFVLVCVSIFDCVCVCNLERECLILLLWYIGCVRVFFVVKFDRCENVLSVWHKRCLLHLGDPAGNEW